jgi:glycosyltransferase involved in cell wall biosynthesis
MIASHPYTFPMLKKHTGAARLVYESHNIEHDLKKTYFPRDDEASRAWLAMVRGVEESACRGSDLVTAVCGEDANDLASRFGVERGKIVVVPNGVATRHALFTGPAARAALKTRLGLDAPLVVFVGSDHGPNVEAVRFVADTLAPRDGRIVYLVAGGVGRRFTGEGSRGTIPANVIFLGTVTDGELRALYRIADAAVNPVFSGSGTNLKLFDYGAHGVPVVSTPFGMRGASPLSGCVTVAERGDFFAALRLRLDEAGSPADLDKVRACRRVIEERYDWGVIARTLGDALMNLPGGK